MWCGLYPGTFGVISSRYQLRQVGRCVESSGARALRVCLCVKWTPLWKHDSLCLLTASQPLTHTHPVARAVPDCSAPATFRNICGVHVCARHHFISFHSSYIIWPLQNDSLCFLLLKVMLFLSKNDQLQRQFKSIKTPQHRNTKEITTHTHTHTGAIILQISK